MKIDDEIRDYQIRIETLKHKINVLENKKRRMYIYYLDLSEEARGRFDVIFNDVDVESYTTPIKPLVIFNKDRI